MLNHETVDALATRARGLRQEAEKIRRGELHHRPQSESWDWWQGFATALEREAASLEGIVGLANIKPSLKASFLEMAIKMLAEINPSLDAWAKETLKGADAVGRESHEAIQRIESKAIKL